ncbi:hypothetical protein SOVF_113970 [Spinacia oleracea]|nr:hypothetical protein SOVF_113970 [Spinacia oleracea]
MVHRFQNQENLQIIKVMRVVKNPTGSNWKLKLATKIQKHHRNGKAATASALRLDNTEAESIIETAHDEYPEWSVIEMGTIAIDATQLANFNQQIGDDENYDEE